MNKNKTTIIAVNRRKRNPLNVRIGSEKIQKVRELNYLSKKIISDERNKNDIKSRVVRAKKVFL